MSVNVLGGPLQACSYDPLTGWFRDGCCRTDDADAGTHVVCARVTDEFLRFSLAAGNDLITPRPQWGFPGLKPGDCWCVCTELWKLSYEAGIRAPVRLEATHENALEDVTLEMLTACARVN